MLVWEAWDSCSAQGEHRDSDAGFLGGRERTEATELWAVSPHRAWLTIWGGEASRDLRRGPEEIA